MTTWLKRDWTANLSPRKQNGKRGGGGSNFTDSSHPPRSQGTDVCRRNRPPTLSLKPFIVITT